MNWECFLLRKENMNIQDGRIFKEYVGKAYFQDVALF